MMQDTGDLLRAMHEFVGHQTYHYEPATISRRKPANCRCKKQSAYAENEPRFAEYLALMHALDENCDKSL